jgi:predicted MFS family arabinose efflux permease
VDRESLSGLRSARGYPQYIVASTVTRMADEMFSVAVVLLVLHRTGSPSLAGATVAAVFFPSIVSGPILGAWLDRSGRRSLLYKVDRALLFCCLVGILLAAGNAPGIVLVALGLAIGVTLPVAWGGFTSMLPGLVGEELLTSANAVEASSFNVALIVGPALAGVIAAVGGAAAAVGAEAVLTLVALALILRIPNLDRPGSGSADSLARLVATGIRHVVREPVLRAVTLTGVVSMAAMGLLVVAFPLWAADDLGSGQSSAGYLWTAYAVGSLVGALLLARLQARFPQDLVFFVGIGSLGALMLTWPLAGSLAVALALVAVTTLIEGPALAADLGVRQQRTPAGLLTQVQTLIGGVKVAAFSLGSAAAGPVVESLGPETTIVIAGAGIVAGVAVSAALRLLTR